MHFSTVPSVTVKMRRFQELLTQLLQQHSALSHVLPALKDVVRNAVNFTSITDVLSAVTWVLSVCLLIPIPSPLECFSSRPRISILISASLNGARKREYIRTIQTSLKSRVLQRFSSRACCKDVVTWRNIDFSRCFRAVSQLKLTPGRGLASQHWLERSENPVTFMCDSWLFYVRSPWPVILWYWRCRQGAAWQIDRPSLIDKTSFIHKSWLLKYCFKSANRENKLLPSSRWLSS